VCRPVGGRDSSGGGRVKTEEEEDGKKAQRPGTTQRGRSIYIYIEPPHLTEGRMMVCVRTTNKAVFVRSCIPGPRCFFIVVLTKWPKAEVAEAHVQLRFPSFKRSRFRLCTIKMAGRYWSEDYSLLFSGHHLSHTHKEKASVSSTLFNI
jgi:hypothetical protein